MTDLSDPQPETSSTETSSTDPVFRRLVDGGLLYDADRECIHHLNETVALICEHWRNGLVEEEIVKVLTSRFEVEDEAAREQIRLALKQLDGTDSA